MRARKFPTKNVFEAVKTVTASFTLTKQDADKLVVYDSTTAILVTLPKVTPSTKGTTFHFQLLQLPSSGGHQLVPHADDSIFASFASSTAAADAKKFYFGSDASGTGDKIGDWVTLVSDGVDGYRAFGQGSFFREA